MPRITTILVCLFLTSSLLAQTPKRPLTAADYDRWESVRSENLSRDGRWVAYQIDPQDGNGRLDVADVSRKAPVKSFARGYMAQFTPDSRYLVMRLKVPVADTRKAKLKKKKPDEMPKDSLLVLTLATGGVQKLPNVKSFMIGKEAGAWVAALQDANVPRLVAEAKSTSKKDTLLPTQPVSTTTVAGKKGPAKKPKGDDLVLLNMADGTRRTVTFVSNVTMSDNGKPCSTAANRRAIR